MVGNVSILNRYILDPIVCRVIDADGIQIEVVAAGAVCICRSIALIMGIDDSITGHAAIKTTIITGFSMNRRLKYRKYAQHHNQTHQH